VTWRGRTRLIRSLIWPAALFAVGSLLFAAAQGLARLDGLRLYGLVQALGEIIGVMGLVWLLSAVVIATRRRKGTVPG
jgi:uncharacterized membrane protein YgdD (TMEM256/DUF423 family)